MLAERVLARGIHAAELIPIRNQPAVVDAYVAAFREAGIVVTAGTEHNTPARIPLEPRCADGSLPSAAALEAFREGTCVVAAHQHLRASGRPGYVDAEGRLNPGFPDGAAPSPLVRRARRGADRRRGAGGRPMSCPQVGGRACRRRPSPRSTSSSRWPTASVATPSSRAVAGATHR